VQESYVFFEDPHHIKLMGILKQFAERNSILVYNNFDSVIDVVCRKRFIEAYAAKNLERDKLEIVIPSSVFIEVGMT